MSSSIAQPEEEPFEGVRGLEEIAVEHFRFPAGRGQRWELTKVRAERRRPGAHSKGRLELWGTMKKHGSNVEFVYYPKNDHLNLFPANVRLKKGDVEELMLRLWTFYILKWYPERRPAVPERGRSRARIFLRKDEARLLSFYMREMQRKMKVPVREVVP